MTISIIREDIYAFSSELANKLQIRRRIDVVGKERSYALPVGPDGASIKFIPRQLLRDLPVASSWGDIESVIAHNEALRLRVNALIASFWKPGQKPHKREIRRIFFENPANLRLLLEAYRGARPRSYDFETDPAGLIEWFALGHESARNSPLRLELPANPTLNEVEAVVGLIVAQFKRNIEDNGLYAHLYDSNGSRRHERYSQLLFYSSADNYCQANNLDLSREPNAGNGPVDFKLSRGAQAKVLVEIKLSSNPNLVQGYQKQLRAYEVSENAQRSFYVIIRVTESDVQIKQVLVLDARSRGEGKRCPTVIVVDGRKPVSASKRR